MNVYLFLVYFLNVSLLWHFFCRKDICKHLLISTCIFLDSVNYQPAKIVHYWATGTWILTWNVILQKRTLKENLHRLTLVLEQPVAQISINRLHNIHTVLLTMFYLRFFTILSKNPVNFVKYPRRDVMSYVVNWNDRVNYIILKCKFHSKIISLLSLHHKWTDALWMSRRGWDYWRCNLYYRGLKANHSELCSQNVVRCFIWRQLAKLSSLSPNRAKRKYYEALPITGVSQLTEAASHGHWEGQEAEQILLCSRA